MTEQQKINWKRSGDIPVLQDVSKGAVHMLQFPLLEQQSWISHGFSTRMGGVSEGCYASMNLSFTKGDDPEKVRENYRRMADMLGMDMERMTLSFQTHTTNVRLVTEEDAGKGIVKERDYTDVDGLITNIPGTTLVTFYADCVPLYFVDPKHKAIGLSHSGWRGTVNRMGQCTIDAMKKAFGTSPKDLITCIGPSICQDCFEVGEEVAEAFMESFKPEWHNEIIAPGKRPDKYQLDLWRANEIIFMEAGVKPENIHTTNICTMCNHEYLFSHRKVGNERGNMGAFLCLR